MATLGKPLLDGVRIISYNLHGFKSSWHYLRELLNGHDIVFIQEHWLQPSELYLLHELHEEFIVFAKSAMEGRLQQGVLVGRPYGGVGVFVRKSLSGVVSLIGYDNDARVVGIKLKSVDFNLLVVGCYFPCNRSSIQYDHDLCQIAGVIDGFMLSNHECKLCILGDMNFECSENDYGYNVFMELMKEYNISPCIDLLTDDVKYTYRHVTLNQSSIIDHVFINCDIKSYIDGILVLDDASNCSDHLPISFALKFPVSFAHCYQPTADSTCIRQYRWDKGNLTDYYDYSGVLLNNIRHVFDCDTSSGSCSNCDHHLDIDIYYSELVWALSSAADRFIPIIPQCALKHYWSLELDELKSNSKCSHEMWVFAGKPRHGVYFDIMRDAKYKYKLAVRQAIHAYESQFSDELFDHMLSKDMSSFWKVWSVKACNKIVSTKCVDGRVCNKDIAELFRDKFCDNVVNTQVTEQAVLGHDSNVNQWACCVDDIESIIHDNMKYGKAAGCDGLTLEHITYGHPSIILHLCKLFNLMMVHGYVPDQFGRGIVIPLVKDKTGNVADASNYRGITVSPVISKIFEGYLLLKFQKYLYSNDLQMGFKRNVGCPPAIFVTQQVVDYYISRRSDVFIAAVDASKAFDRINHYTLFNKLRVNAIPHIVLSIF